MAGIVSYGAYIPYYRLSRNDIARAWGGSLSPGERAVANYDEDSLTMAVAAARDCIQGFNAEDIDGLYFASTTAPYKDKQCAATIAAVLGLPSNAATMDFSGSLRCGSNALKAALDAVNAGAAQNILVCVADSRLGYPAGPNEMSFGDGGAALLVGKTGVVAEISGFYSKYYEIQDIWRSDRDVFVRSAEDRFAMDEGYSRVIVSGVSSSLKEAQMTPRDFSKIAFYSPNIRQLRAVSQRLGFDEKTQIRDVMHPLVGDTGSAMTFMNLAAVLEDALPDQTLLAASYGNGCDIFILKTTEGLKGLRGKRGMGRYLNSRGSLTNYGRYLKWRELMPTQPPARPPLEIRQPSPSAQWREVQWELRLTGTKCRHCGTPQYPPQRVCTVCQTKDEMDPYTFYDKPAKVFSFCHDFVMQTIDPPVTVTVVDFDGGGRIMCDMTDRDPDAIKVGIPLEMSFRRLYYVGGIYNYWWKCHPVR